MYIVIEGQDGTGKTTQAQLLQQHFAAQGRQTVLLEESNGDLPQAHDIHDIVLTKGYDLEPFTYVLFFTAARLEMWRKIAEPVLKQGGVVISARNYWSTLAYQGYGDGVSRNKIIRLTKMVMPEKYLNPDLGVILAIPDQIRLERVKTRGAQPETYDKKPAAFQRKVNAAYPKIAKDFHLHLLDASGTVEEISAAIKQLL